jgi:hypothetical protein
MNVSERIERRARLLAAATCAVNEAELSHCPDLVHAYVTLEYLTADILAAIRDGATTSAYRAQLGHKVAAVGILMIEREQA